MIPRMRDFAATLAQQVIISTKTTRHHSNNTYCIEKTEDDEDAYSKTPETSYYTHSGNLDYNSRKVIGGRITITSDQENHLSETKPTENGTRPLTLDHTPWKGPSHIG